MGKEKTKRKPHSPRKRNLQYRSDHGATRIFAEELMDPSWLGSISDKQLAELVGISLNYISAERQRRGIPPYRRCRDPIKWNKKMIDRLGTDTDKAIGKMFGIAENTVMVKRTELGIAPFGGKRKPQGSRYSWPKRLLDMLGKVSDKEMARQIGCSPGLIGIQRRKLGIPPWKPPVKVSKWTKKMIARLGKTPDTELARCFGLKVGQVRHKRYSLGIPAFRNKHFALIVTDEVKRILAVYTPREAAERLGIHLTSVYSYRKKYGIKGKSGRNEYQWKPEALKLLGRYKDEIVAKILGIAVFPVRVKRRSLKIPAFKPDGWTKQMLIEIGTMPDTRFAHKYGITRERVHNKRYALNIPRYRKL